MLYDLVQTRHGKEKVMMTDSLPKVNNRMKELRTSHRKGVKGERVSYQTRPSQNKEKFEAKPIGYPWKK